jgi:prepilin peptidase CpaA
MIMVADAIRLTLFPAMMAFAASSDLLTMTISNRVSLILVGGFFALAAIGGVNAADVFAHLAAGCVVLVAAFGLFARGIIGGGDAKLAAATALWLGFEHLLPYLLYASLLGGALSVALIWFRMAPLPDWLARHAWVGRLHGKDGGVPYGIALAAAALAVYPDTPWMALATWLRPSGGAIDLPIINSIWIRGVNHPLTLSC